MLKKNVFLLPLIILLSMLIPNNVFANASRYASSVIVSNINAEADDKEKVLINIYLRDRMNNPEKGTVFIGTDRGSIDKLWIKKNNNWVSVSDLSKEAGDKVFYISKNIVQAEIDGSLELGMSSTVKGRANIGVSLKGERELGQYLSGHITDAQAEIIPVKYADIPKTLTHSKYHKVEVEHDNGKRCLTYTENKIYINVLNESNDRIVLADDIKDVQLDVELLNKPETAEITLGKSPTWKTDLKSIGSTYLLVNSNKPGEIEVEIDLKLMFKNSFNPELALYKKITLDIVPKKFGAGEIILYLNQETAVVDNKAHKLSLVPFLENGRTFVPVRFFAEALGAEIKWFPEAQTVVLYRPDRMITMTVGNSVLLLDNGETIKTDVGPFIKDGFTVLPFRVIAEAFGAQVTAGYNNFGQVERVIIYNN